MALINDKDSHGNPVVALTPIVKDVKYMHPTFPMTVWPPIYADGSKPYGDPLVHLFYIDTNNHAKWMRMNPAVDERKWTLVQDFGFMTGIMVYRGVVTMWNTLFSRSYNFYGGSELTFSDGRGGPTTSGANPAGNNLFTNQPFHSGSEQFWAAYDNLGSVNAFGQPIQIHEAFGCYLFCYYRQTATFEDSVIITPPGKAQTANPAGATSGVPVRAFLSPVNYGTEAGIGAIVAAGYDASLGYGGNVMAVIGTPMVVQDPPTILQNGAFGTQPPPRLSVPFHTLTPKRLDPATGQQVDDAGFPIAYGFQTQFRAFQTFTDFAGASGGAGSNSYVGYFGGGNTGGVVSRGSFHPGYYVQGNIALAKGDAEVWDQGLLSPEASVTSSLYRNGTFMWGVDAIGLVGSNYVGSTYSGSAEVQNDGTSTRFGKCRIVGNTGLTFLGSFAPPIMPISATGAASLGLWTSTAVYWLTDSAPTSRDTFGRIVPISQAPAEAPLVFSYADVPIPSSSTPLGSGSSDTSLPHFDLETLLRACADPSLLPNPNQSFGSSPVLRALLEMCGIPYKVIREVANDGQINGHMGGNALDITGPSPYLTGDATALSDQADQELVDLAGFIRNVPELWSVALRVNVDNDSESLYVLDGKIVTKQAFTTVNQKDTQRFIHVASSADRISKALRNASVQAALGVGPATAELKNGKIVFRQSFQLGQFGSRYVYVNQDQLQNVGKGVKGLSVSKEQSKTVHFW